jgi:5-methylcytosine-specific restriction endonuclease McrA
MIRRLSDAEQLTARGGTRRWDRLSKQVAQEEKICWLRLPGCTIRSTSADHVLPSKTHPHLRMVRSNLRGVCRSCNTRRRDTPVWAIPQLRRKLEAQAQRRRATALGFFR